MKIAYILYPQVVISNRSNGIRSQAETWATLLSEKGHEVVCINNWENYNWSEFDAIHLFGGGSWMYVIAKRLHALNNNIIWSPIVDPKDSFQSLLRDKMKCLFNKLSCGVIRTTIYEPTKAISYIKTILTRSKFESDYVRWLYQIPKDKISLIPLSYSPSCTPYNKCVKEEVCLHISSIYQSRKNVVKLVKAARKYGFKLVLAGNKGSDEQFKPIKEAIGDAQNIEVLGFVSEEEKIDLYKRAKVFALPSKIEGVGIVAVDAAYYGCEIVITNIPGPKEYYGGKCIEVDPNDIDSIGSAVMKFINNDLSYQPQLSSAIASELSGDAIINKLIKAYTKNITNVK